MTWMLLRTTGIVVLGLLTIAVALGIAGPAIRSPQARLLSVTLHRTAAVTGTLLLLAHVTFAVLDTWVTVSPLAVVLPGASAWKPLWIGLGAVAFDAVLLLAATSALRRRAATVWWNVHVISYVAYALAWGHALGAGSDVGGPIMRWLAVGSAAAVAAAGLLRLTASGAPVGVGLPRQKEVVSR
jgi:sulfoxide reductase heme-binding subunit YedZ